MVWRKRRGARWRRGSRRTLLDINNYVNMARYSLLSPFCVPSTMCFKVMSFLSSPQTHDVGRFSETGEIEGRDFNNLPQVAWPAHMQSKVLLTSTLYHLSFVQSWKQKQRGPGEVKFWNNSKESDFCLKEGPRTRENKDLITDSKPFTGKDADFRFAPGSSCTAGGLPGGESMHVLGESMNLWWTA